MRRTGQCRHGAVFLPGLTRFQLWARRNARVELLLEGRACEMSPRSDGILEAVVEGVEAGARYWYRIDGQGPFPDPASRFQPDGVHGASQVVDALSFRWTDQDFVPADPARRVFYELHVGTFTPAGTFQAVEEKLGYLRDLGITAVELMPVADFPGGRSWGYDGVSLYAPARCYGTPDDLRRLVNAAHGAGLAVFLDVVYNHLGPDGAYHRVFQPSYYSRKHQTPWGDGLNFDDEDSEHARSFFIDNAAHWIREYHIDGLRLDAIHAIEDTSETHFVAELAEAVRQEAAAVGRIVTVIGEDNRNWNVLLRPRAEGGYGLHGVWADDFHHQMRVNLAGDRDGYYSDYSGAVADIARTVEDGWFYRGQYSKYRGAPRGTDPRGLPKSAMVICLQNHDQIGNRAFGERLHHQVDAARWRAASALLLLAPETPLLFMGQEWAASAPFRFFTDHKPELGELVTLGRRKEFERFAAFSDPVSRETIPDPQAAGTFLASKLPWEESNQPEHAACLEWYRRLLRARAETTAGETQVRCSRHESAIVLQWVVEQGEILLVVVLSGAAHVPMTGSRAAGVMLSSEDAACALDPEPIEFLPEGAGLVFRRAGAILFGRVQPVMNE